MLQTVLSNPLFTPIVVTIVIIALFPLVAGYIVLVERKVLADFQVRLGPMRVGPHGLLQPIADALKLFPAEAVSPDNANSGRESSPVGRPDFKSGRGREPVLGGFDSLSLPPR